MSKRDQIEIRADREVEAIERDPNLTDKEKDEQIREIYKEAREMMRDADDEEDENYRR